MRNENGGGTVYKMSGKRRKPWIAVMTVGYDIEKGQVRKTIGTYATKREGQEALFSYQKNPMLYSKKTFREIREMWWSSYTKKITNESTVKTITKRIKSLESLENLAITDIKLHHLQKLFDEMDLSWNSKSSYKSLLNMIFEYALKNDFIDTNKIKFIELGKKKSVIPRRVFSQDEIEILWKNKDDSYVYIILILIYTGMRIGEFINLRNEDIDLVNGIIKINVSKTENGLRTIPISSKIYELIKNNMKPSQEYFLRGDNTNQLGYSTFEQRFNKLLNRLDIREHTIHDTRHTFATLLNNANANSTSIMRLVGHSDFSTTENVYTHKSTEELRKAVELLN